MSRGSTLHGRHIADMSKNLFNLFFDFIVSQLTSNVKRKIRRVALWELAGPNLSEALRGVHNSLYIPTISHNATSVALCATLGGHGGQCHHIMMIGRTFVHIYTLTTPPIHDMRYTDDGGITRLALRAVKLLRANKMGKTPTGERKYAIQEMWAIHREIARLIVLGMTNKDIALQLEISEAMVSYTRNSPVVQREIDQMNSVRNMEAIDVAKKIQELAGKAVVKLEKLMDSATKEDLQARIAESFLDRAGHAAVKTIRSENVHAFLSKDDILDIKERAREIGLVNVTEGRA